MGDPADGDFYDHSNPISYVDGLQGKLLLIHGMADDNVFFDNSVKLMAALQKEGKQFELMTYPGKRHGISGEAERTHLNQLRLDFFKRYLQP
jgi:dipeptidyl-peptidase-4